MITFDPYTGSWTLDELDTPYEFQPPVTYDIEQGDPIAENIPDEIMAEVALVLGCSPGEASRHLDESAWNEYRRALREVQYDG